MENQMLGDIKEILFSEEQLTKIVERIGEQSARITKTKICCLSVC